MNVEDAPIEREKDPKDNNNGQRLNVQNENLERDQYLNVHNDKDVQDVQTEGENGLETSQHMNHKDDQIKEDPKDDQHANMKDV